MIAGRLTAAGMRLPVLERGPALRSYWRRVAQERLEAAAKAALAESPAEPAPVLEAHVQREPVQSDVVVVSPIYQAAVTPHGAGCCRGAVAEAHAVPLARAAELGRPLPPSVPSRGPGEVARQPVGTIRAAEGAAWKRHWGSTEAPGAARGLPPSRPPVLPVSLTTAPGTSCPPPHAADHSRAAEDRAAAAGAVVRFAASHTAAPAPGAGESEVPSAPAEIERVIGLPSSRPPFRKYVLELGMSLRWKWVRVKRVREASRSPPCSRVHENIFLMHLYRWVRPGPPTMALR